jgi:hypothetical protein
MGIFLASDAKKDGDGCHRKSATAHGFQGGIVENNFILHCSDKNKEINFENVMVG